MLCLSRVVILPGSGMKARSHENTLQISFFIHFGEAIFFYDFAYCIHESGPLPEIICFPIKSFSYSAIMTCIVWLNCKTNWIWYAGYHTLYTLSRTIFEYFLRQMKSTFWSTVAILSRSYSILWTHGQWFGMLNIICYIHYHRQSLNISWDKWNQHNSFEILKYCCDIES